MKRPSPQLSSIYLYILFLLQYILAYGSDSREKLVLNPEEAGFLPQRLLQNNQYTCPTGRSCLLRASPDKTYIIYLNNNADVASVLDLDGQTQDLIITYSSSVSSTSITSEMAISPQNIPIAPPSGNSWTFTVKKSILQSGDQFIWDIDNESNGLTTITFKMSFQDSTSSSSSSSTSALAANSQDNSDSGSSMLKILLPIFGVLAVMMILGVWCHHRKARQQRIQRLERVRRHRRGSNNHQGADDEEEEEEEEEDSLTEVNLAERFPEAKIETIKSSFPQTTCSICLEEFQKEAACRQLYCEHVFHSECIKLWLINQLKKGHAFCPNCNKDMMKKTEKAEEAGNQA